MNINELFNFDNILKKRHICLVESNRKDRYIVFKNLEDAMNYGDSTNLSYKIYIDQKLYFSRKRLSNNQFLEVYSSI